MPENAMLMLHDPSALVLGTASDMRAMAEGLDKMTAGIFGSSAFSMVALTDAINKMPYVPGRIGQLGLFREQGVSPPR